jgi:selenophosphate synthase
MKTYSHLGTTIGRLVEEKDQAYGSSFQRSQEILKILYPDGVQPDQYCDMLAMTRVIDKLFRIANRKEAFGESPWQDIAGYGILGVANEVAEEEEVTGETVPLQFSQEA